MLGFLKKLLSKEPAVPTEAVELANLSTWFEEKTKSKIEGLNSRLKETNQKISQEIEQARSNINSLNEAKLMNPDIPERAKHFMQGNRDAYSKKTSLFLDKISAPDTVQNFPVFYSAVQNELKELMQGTAKSFQILQEFFANESRQVMASIGNIGKEANLFKQAFDDAGLHILDDTKKAIVDFQTKLKLKTALEKDLENAQKELEEHTAEITKLKEDIELLQKDRDLNALKDAFKKIQAKIEETRGRITTPFSVINPALRKFERITYRHRLLVQGYIESPLDALMKDLHLSILKALHDLELAIMNSRIELKDKKKDRTLETLKLLTKEYLGSFLTEYGQAKQEQDKIRKQLENLDVVVLLKEKKAGIEKRENARIDVERKIALFSKELEKTSIQELEDVLIENLRKITNTQVKLVI